MENESHTSEEKEQKASSMEKSISHACLPVSESDGRQGNLFALPPAPGDTGNTLPALSSRKRSGKQRQVPSGTAYPRKKCWYGYCQRCQLQGKKTYIEHASPYVVMALMTDHIEAEHALECYFCYLKFASFKELAEHVEKAHVPPERRREKAPTWYGTDEEIEGMSKLPVPGGGKNDTQRGNTGGGGGRTPPTVPFIKVENLTQEPKRAKILAVKTKDTGFNDMILKIGIGGTSYFFGLKASNENYETLWKAFGDNDTDWIGQEFSIGLQWNEFYEKNFVQVFEAFGGKEKGKKPKA